MKQELRGMTQEELESLLTGMGQPRFRAGQLFDWLHKKRAASFDEMTNLPLALRKKLEEGYTVGALKTVRRLESRLDGTKKFLFELWDGACVEAVWMEYKHGNTVCISTQVGCRMGCRFCASTLGGLVRNLTSGEMLGEIYQLERECGRIGGVVLMGIGEPLDNFENVVRFLQLLSSPGGMNLSLRHVSLSTCGLVPEIDRLAEYRFPLTLSISLHAPDDETRGKIMPVNQRYPVGELMAACERYFERTGRRISFEYALIAGETDTSRHAEKLVRLLAGKNCHVNLIPVNPVKERGYQRGSRQEIERFRRLLEQGGINATVRRELGSDINAACGQLRRETAAKEDF